VNPLPSNPGRLIRLQCALLVLAAALVACKREDIRVYRLAKEAEPVPAAANLPPGHPDMGGAPSEKPTGQPAMPQLHWKLPAGWEEAPPGQMRVASFKVKGEGKQQADVSVVPLPGLAGGDLNNVNRWRGQVGLPPLKEEEFAKLGQPIEIAGQPSQLYDQAGENAASGGKTRILGAVLHREGMAWFFKMTGDDALVAQQKPAFVEFLKSLSFTARPSDAP
jgi:hypothetical protein